MKFKDSWQQTIILETMEKPSLMKGNLFGSKRKNSDEHYVIDLCDEVLNEQANRQYCFEFLRGDPCSNFPLGKKLPVDAYYDSLKLVVEYYERQHTESVKYFNKNTVSGVTRDEQRRIYDERRKKVLPENGIDLVVLSYTDFKQNSRKRLIRDRNTDIEVIRQKLMPYIDAQTEVHKD